ncbi:MAG TPA: CDP-alcohol phosphatidyltransferase family protein [Thermoplasmata archaeon]|nr:CDP-alcohol phosphatidyltransferase family protein [Thermoplasmata archaeon]
MVLNKYRRKIDSFLTPVAKAFSGISPNMLSVISLICAVLMFFTLVLWRDPFALVVALVLVILNGFFDAIDGAVARITGKGSPKGDLVDHVIDRYADFFMIAGVGMSAFAHAELGLIALGSVMIASYMGTQSQALGMKRDYGGILGRAERMVLLMIFLPVQYVSVMYYMSNPHIMVVSDFGISVLDVLLVILIVASTVTALQRLLRMWRAL